MKIRDLKPGEQYVTKRRHLVVPQGEKVEAVWVEEYVRGDDGRLVRPTQTRVIRYDPAADPLKLRLNTVNDRPAHRPGIWVKRYDVNENGELAGDGTDMIVDARDIAGTWAQYTQHYPDEIEMMKRHACEQGTGSAGPV